MVLAVAFDRSKVISASDDGTLRTWVWAARGPKKVSSSQLRTLAVRGCDICTNLRSGKYGRSTLAISQSYLSARH